MDYQQRLQIITTKLNTFLREYQRPEHLTTELALQEIRRSADAVNKRIAASIEADGLRNSLEEICQIVAENHRGRDWPVTQEFAKACDSFAKTPAVKEFVQAQPEFKLDPLQRAADRMNAGESVGDGFLYGRSAVELLETGMVSKDTMRQYRSQLYFDAKKAWGDEQAVRMENAMIQRHDAAIELVAAVADETGRKSMAESGFTPRTFGQ